MADKSCEYVAKWKYDEDRDMIDFEIQSIYTEKWTGIGFSNTPQMTKTDVVVGFVEANGRSRIMDMWATSYLSPVLDSSQVTDYFVKHESNFKFNIIFTGFG